MPHNVALPTHRYVYVADEFVHRQHSGHRVPAVWWGVSSDAGRALGCHVLLESGALVLDLPLHALAHQPVAPVLELAEVCAWDAFGPDIELYEMPYLAGLTASLLDERHHATALDGELWFGMDWLRNGWSQYPEQHKHLLVVAVGDGTLRALPQDRLLVHEASFTEHNGVPPIARQRTVWSAER